MSQPSISNARAIVGLSAAGTATRPLVAGTVNIGQPQLTIPFPTCDIAFSAKVLLSTAQTASVNLATLAVTPSTSGSTGSTGTLDPTGANNDILLTSDTTGTNPTTVALAIDAVTDRTQLTAVQTGDDIVVTSGDKRRMSLGGTLLDVNGASITTPLVLDVDTSTARPFYSKNGGQDLIGWDGSEWSILVDGGMPSFISTEDVATPDLVTTWVPQGSASGTPTVTPVAASAAQTIVVINAGSFGITASNAPANDGTGAIAAVTAVSLTGGVTREWVGPQVDFQGVGYPTTGEILGIFLRVVEGSAEAIIGGAALTIESGGVVAITNLQGFDTPGTLVMEAFDTPTEVEIVILAAS